MNTQSVKAIRQHRSFQGIETKKYVQQQGQPSIFQRSVSILCLATTLLFSIVPLGANPLVNTNSSSNSLGAKKSGTRGLNIISPRNGATVDGGDVQIKVAVSRRYDIGSLKARLNGKAISSILQPSGCEGEICFATTELSAADGLRNGRNGLFVVARGGQHHRDIDIARSNFSFKNGTLLGDPAGDSVDHYDPSSIGFLTVGNGGNGGTWINLTTGYAQGATDDTTNYPQLTQFDEMTHSFVPTNPSLPFQDAQITVNCTGYIYQAVVLDRTQPSVKLASACSNIGIDNTVTQLNSQLSALDKPALNDPQQGKDYLFIFGTTPSHYAIQGLNTSAFGGTDYSSLWATAAYPSYYIMIGVPGSNAGSAQEAYLRYDADHTFYPTLGGTLVSNGPYYNYVAAGEVPFQVISGTQGTGVDASHPCGSTGSPCVRLGNLTFTPPANADGKFWLLAFDRYYLLPANPQTTNHVDCSSSQLACGALFDERTDVGSQELATTLHGLNSNYLIFLTAVGCPVDMAAQYSSTLGNVLQSIGGMKYTLDYLSTKAGTCGYSLVSVNDGKHQYFTSKAALSADQFSSNGHAGALQGFLAADQTGMLDVAQKAQMIKNNNGSFSNALDYTFENLSSQQRVDWQYTDTPGHLAAYHDVSYQILTNSGVNETGANNFDIRFFYTAIGGPLDNIDATYIDNHLTANAPNALMKSSWDTATDQEFVDVREQIGTEISQARNVRNYLINGIRTTVLQGSQSAILNAASTVANDIGQDEADATNTTVNANTANWMNFAAGLISVGGALASIDNPATASMLGTLSGMFWSGSAASVPLGPTTNAGPNTPYDMLLSDLKNKATNYSSNLLKAFDGATDNILSDAGKLSVAGALTSGTGTGWTIDNVAAADNLANVVTAGAKAALWTDVLPQLYGVRQATQMAFNDPATFGSEVYNEFKGKNYCSSVYAPDASGTVPATSMIADHGIGFLPSLHWDVNIIAEGTTPQNGAGVHDYAMSSNLSTLLTTSQTVTISSGPETGLNIPAMMLIKNGPWTYSPISLFNPSSPCVASN
jgi:hypothetical protein